MVKSANIIKIFAGTPGFYVIGPKVTTSGNYVPIYPDLRKTFSDPRRLKIICQEILKFIRDKKIKFDCIIGGVTAGIPIATALSLMSGKLHGYVRKEPKKGGTAQALEGNFKKGMTAILVDDATGHGASKVKFIKNIRQAGLKINWVIVPVSRSNRRQDAKKYRRWIKPSKVRLQSFCDLYDIINYSYRHKIISKDARTLLHWYVDDAFGWQKDKTKLAFFRNYLKTKTHKSKSGV